MRCISPACAFARVVARFANKAGASPRAKPNALTIDYSVQLEARNPGSRALPSEALQRHLSQGFA